MCTNDIVRAFEGIGARAVVRRTLLARQASPWRFTRRSIITREMWNEELPTALNIGRDAKGQFYDLRVRSRTELRVTDARGRHLLLMSIDGATGERAKYLCGHDEREWFIAGVPDVRGVSGVASAMEALKPREVRVMQESAHVPASERGERRTAVYQRQGEWFFLPRPQVQFPLWLVLKDEPLRRGNGKPHMASYAVRRGGVLVYVSRRYPNGLTEEERSALLREQPTLARERWLPMRRDPEVYVRGYVTHPDHERLHLRVWHLVLMNEEHRAPGAMRNVAFLD